MVEIKRLTADDVKDKSLVYLLVRASHELESGPRAYPVCMASLMAQRLESELCDEQGELRVLSADVDAVWKKAADAALPNGSAESVDAMKRDLLALKDYNPATANPVRVDEMLRFIACLRDGLEGRETKPAGRDAPVTCRAA